MYPACMRIARLLPCSSFIVYSLLSSKYCPFDTFEILSFLRLVWSSRHCWIATSISSPATSPSWSASLANSLDEWSIILLLWPSSFWPASIAFGFKVMLLSSSSPLEDEMLVWIWRPLLDLSAYLFFFWDWNLCASSNLPCWLEARLCGEEDSSALVNLWVAYSTTDLIFYRISCMSVDRPLRFWLMVEIWRFKLFSGRRLPVLSIYRSSNKFVMILSLLGRFVLRAGSLSRIWHANMLR